MEGSALAQGRFLLRIHKAVYRKCTREWHMRPHALPMDNLTYVFDGEIDYTIQGRAAHLTAGDLVYVPAGEMRQAEPSQHNQVRLFSFDFYIHDERGNALRLPLETYTHLGIRQELALLCRLCCSEWIRQAPGYRMKANAYLMELMHGILFPMRPGGQVPVRDKRIAGMMEQILERADEKLQLQDFAREMHLSPVYLGTLFRQETGETFHQYLMNCRLNRAEDLLESGAYSALEVMLQCGFNDYAYFTRAFKHRFGVSPGKYTRLETELPLPPDVLRANAAGASPPLIPGSDAGHDAAHTKKP